MILAASVIEKARASFGLKAHTGDNLRLLMLAELANAIERRRIQYTAYEAPHINFIPEGFWDGVYEAVQ